MSSLSLIWGRGKAGLDRCGLSQLSQNLAANLKAECVVVVYDNLFTDMDLSWCMCKSMQILSLMTEAKYMDQLVHDGRESIILDHQHLWCLFSSADINSDCVAS